MLQTYSRKYDEISTIEKENCDGLFKVDACVFLGSKDLGRIALKLTIVEGRKVSKFLSGPSREAVTPPQLGALQDCIQLFDLTLSDLEKSLLNVSNSNSNFLAWRQAFDVETWLSAALTNQATCLEGFQKASGGRQITLSSNLHNVSRLLSNSLAAEA
ncbi:hypothetical protein SUGI_0608550 [Cryptomeria japonica]|nr:hypothetical protein SUGI_0608550 [Cryptomeria japonica]